MNKAYFSINQYNNEIVIVGTSDGRNIINEFLTITWKDGDPSILIPSEALINSYEEVSSLLKEFSELKDKQDFSSYTEVLNKNYEGRRLM